MPRQDTQFKAGQGRPPGAGRRKGSRNKVPAGVKASVRRALEEVAREQPDLIKNAIERGLAAPPPKSFMDVQLAAYYLDGKPSEHVQLSGRPPLSIVYRTLRPGEDPLEDGSRADDDAPSGEIPIGPS